MICKKITGTNHKVGDVVGTTLKLDEIELELSGTVVEKNKELYLEYDKVSERKINTILKAQGL